MIYYSRTGKKNCENELLKVHLQKVSHLAGEFASAFNEKTEGELCGLYHDAGKASQAFQNVLEGKEFKVNHESAGAFLLYKSKLYSLARVVFAHHKGLDGDIKQQLIRTVNENENSFDNTGRKFSVFGKNEYENLLKYYKENNLLKKINIKTQNYGDDNLSEMLNERMLLSALADADYLASASFFDERILEEAKDNSLNAEKVYVALNVYRDNIIKASKSESKINDLRNTVYNDCLKSAENKRGFFTLTAPTGTGKTLALMAFALKHAIYNGHRRIIIVLPFLSIINQNVNIYKKICSELIESHSMAEYDETTKLLSERWNSPVVVTTSVKFFETLFKRKPTDLRFLHSVANSVIVFDEAQCLPHELLSSSMKSLESLCKNFNCSVVLSTATQPDINEREGINIKLNEIIGNPQKIFQEAKRVNINWNTSNETDFYDIAEEMASKESVCCVVNRKDHSHKLYDLMVNMCDRESCFYLSTDMCNLHRDKVLKEIYSRISDNLPCRLVATSCIEAGVDLDFEYMYRALAPLEAIVQCAGRCNRNGKRTGSMSVFIPNEEKLYPSTFYGNAANIVQVILSRHEIDINNLNHIKEYYRELFTRYNRDKGELTAAIRESDYEKTEKEYKIINNGGVNILVPYGDKIELYRELSNEARIRGITKAWLKRAAPITVTSYDINTVNSVCEKCKLVLPDGTTAYSDSWFILNDKKYYKNTGLALYEYSNEDMYFCC